MPTVMASVCIFLQTEQLLLSCSFWIKWGKLFQTGPIWTLTFHCILQINYWSYQYSNKMLRSDYDHENSCIISCSLAIALKRSSNEQEIHRKCYFYDLNLTEIQTIMDIECSKRAAAVLTVTSDGLKRNCLLRLDFSMVSMSVTMTSPSPAASPIMAKFFSNSQPMAPAPTWNDTASDWEKLSRLNCLFYVMELFKKQNPFIMISRRIQVLGYANSMSAVQWVNFSRWHGSPLRLIYLETQ